MVEFTAAEDDPCCEVHNFLEPVEVFLGAISVNREAVLDARDDNYCLPPPASGDTDRPDSADTESEPGSASSVSGPTLDATIVGSECGASGW